MKIAHVIGALSFGGSEQVGIDLAIAQSAAGHETQVIALRDPAAELLGFSLDLKRRLQEAGVPFVELGGSKLRLDLLKVVPALAAKIRRERYDIVHCHADPAEFVTSMARRLVRFPVARTIHSVVLWPTHPRMGWLTERRLSDDLVIAVSEDAMAAHKAQRRKFGLPITPNKTVIPNGVPHVQGEPRPDTQAGTVRMGFFGRAVPQKGLDILFDALDRLATRLPPIEVTVYSDAASGAEWRERAARHAHFLRLVGPVPNARALMAGFDVILMPSRFEGLPLVALEAFSAGTPVLATDSAGLREALPPSWPLVMPIEDPAALEGMIRRIADGEWDLASLSAVVREHGRKSSLEGVAEQYLTAYRHFLDKRGNHGASRVVRNMSGRRTNPVPEG